MRRILASLLLCVFVLAGCRSSQTTPATSTEGPKVYKLRGKVVSTNSSTGQVMLDHQAIPGFMDAMVMPYKLKDPSILTELHPGDIVTADLIVSQDANADILLDHIVVVAQGKPDYKPTVSYHVPTQGDAVPNFKFRNQDGHPLDLAQFKGKALLITFIYTRCPRADFCPRVTRNFVQVDRQLAGTPALYQQTHLLCVSFDPDNDTPERLRAYGAQYIGSDSKQAFSHWDFAVPARPVLQKMAEFFNVGITTGSDNTITHTLSTTLIGPDGKVVKFYPGNDWTADQVASDVKQLLAGKG